MPNLSTVAAGDKITVDKFNELITTINNMRPEVPAGAISHFAMQTAPRGWLVADGSTISRTTYAALFNAIGTTYGVGNGSTTFRLPDFRGEFLRGWDAGRGVDAGRNFASFQADLIKSHTHTGSFASPASQYNWWGWWDWWWYWNNYSTNGAGPAANVGWTGGNETRPRNVAVLICIKYAPE